MSESAAGAPDTGGTPDAGADTGASDSGGDPTGGEAFNAGDSAELGTARAANDNGKAPAAEPEPWRKAKHKVTVRDKEIEVPYEELVANYQLKRASYERLEEAARLKKQMDGLLAGLRDGASKGDFGPLKKLATKLGYDVRRFSEAELTEALRQEQMTPEERRRADLDLKERELKHREETWEKKRTESEINRVAKQLESEYAQSIPAALKAAGVPQTPYQQRRLASLLHEAIGSDTGLTVEEAAQIVAEEYREEVTAHLGELDVDGVLALIGEERMKEVRRRDIERVRNGGAAPPPPSGHEPAKDRPRAKPQQLTPDEFFRKVLGKASR